LIDSASIAGEDFKPGLVLGPLDMNSFVGSRSDEASGS
jgi:hypothetical protein